VGKENDMVFRLLALFVGFGVGQFLTGWNTTLMVGLCLGAAGLAISIRLLPLD
jgi:hypothetical protein